MDEHVTADKKIILFTIHCTRCRVLEKKLEHAGIKFEKNDDVAEMKRRGYTSAPMLDVDGVSYNFTEAVDWLKGLEA